MCLYICTVDPQKREISALKVFTTWTFDGLMETMTKVFTFLRFLRWFGFAISSFFDAVGLDAM